MADYARQGDYARSQRSMSEQVRRIRTRRPLRASIRSMTWQMEGPITLARTFMPGLVTIDPISGGDYPEFKQVIAITGWKGFGADVIVDWQWNGGYFHSGQVVTGSPADNWIVLPTPLIIQNDLPTTSADKHGQFLQPEISVEPTSGVNDLAVMAIIETVPI